MVPLMLGNPHMEFPKIRDPVKLHLLCLGFPKVRGLFGGSPHGLWYLGIYFGEPFFRKTTILWVTGSY